MRGLIAFPLPPPIVQILGRFTFDNQDQVGFPKCLPLFSGDSSAPFGPTSGQNRKREMSIIQVLPRSSRCYAPSGASSSRKHTEFMQKHFDPAAGTNDENVRYGLSPTDIGFRRNLDKHVTC
jgi:hypothetical protein